METTVTVMNRLSVLFLLFTLIAAVSAQYGYGYPGYGYPGYGMYGGYGGYPMYGGYGGYGMPFMRYGYGGYPGYYRPGLLGMLLGKK